MFSILVTVFVLCPAAGNAQMRPGKMVETGPFNPAVLSGKSLLYDKEKTGGRDGLFVDIDATAWFYDAEYAHALYDGFTDVGMRLRPTIGWNMGNRGMLQIGFTSSLLAGLDSLHELRPIVRLCYAPARWLTVVAGSIYGGANHGLEAVLYDPDRAMMTRQEEGLQIMTHTSFWHSDTWVDWWHYLVPGTADQEYFTMGSSHNMVIVDRALHGDSSATSAEFRLEMPLIFLANHRGGQVNTIDTSVLTHFNERAALRGVFTIPCSRVAHELAFEMPVYFYHRSDHAENGFAVNPNVTYSCHHAEFQHRAGWNVFCKTGFWHGDGFASYFGSPQFQTLYLPSTTDKVRQLLWCGVGAEHGFGRIGIGMDVRFYYDLTYGEHDLTVGVYMRARQKVYPRNKERRIWKGHK